MPELGEPEFHAARRPVREWLAGLGWLLLLVFTVQGAAASRAEHEHQAAAILWGLAAVLLVGGAIVFYARRTAGAEDEPGSRST